MDLDDKEKYREGLAYWVTVYGRENVTTDILINDIYMTRQFTWDNAADAGWLLDTKSGFQITDKGIAFAFEEES